MATTEFIPLSLSQAPEALQRVPDSFEFKLLKHRLSAGFPSPAADYAEDGLDLNDYLVRRKSATYMFTVKGDSMIGASIEEGDKVVVDRSLRPRHNDIVVAVVDGEYTIKRLHKHRGRVELRPVPQPPFGTWHRWLANHEVFAAPGVPSTALLQRMLATINSYYGVFSHAHTYRLRKHIYQKELGPLKRFFLPDGASYQHLRIRKVWLQWRE